MQASDVVHGPLSVLVSGGLSTVLQLYCAEPGALYTNEPNRKLIARRCMISITVSLSLRHCCIHCGFAQCELSWTQSHVRFAWALLLKKIYKKELSFGPLDFQQFVAVLNEVFRFVWCRAGVAALSSIFSGSSDLLC